MPEPLSRRRFLLQLTVLGGAILLTPSQIMAAPAAWVPVGPASKFGKGGYTQVILPGDGEEAVFINQQADDSYLALSGRCTHKGCPVEWQNDHKEFLCPCHRGRYDDKGKNISGPPPHPLNSLPTRVDPNGVLFVQSSASR